jgi:hypothetical protein
MEVIANKCNRVPPPYDDGTWREWSGVHGCFVALPGPSLVPQVAINMPHVCPRLVSHPSILRNFQYLPIIRNGVVKSDGGKQQQEAKQQRLRLRETPHRLCSNDAFSGTRLAETTLHSWCAEYTRAHMRHITVPKTAVRSASPHCPS